MKLSYLLALGAFALSFLASLTPAQAQRPPANNWRLLAFKTVGAGTDRDTIHVRSNSRYRQIQLCAFNAPLRMNDFNVRFDNGRRQDVRVRSRINAGTCTRAIALTNAPRRIARVDLTYQRIQRGVRAPLVRVMVR